MWFEWSVAKLVFGVKRGQCLNANHHKFTASRILLSTVMETMIYAYMACKRTKIDLSKLPIAKIVLSRRMQSNCITYTHHRHCRAHRPNTPLINNVFTIRNLGFSLVSFTRCSLFCSFLSALQTNPHTYIINERWTHADENGNGPNGTTAQARLKIMKNFIVLVSVMFHMSMTAWVGLRTKPFIQMTVADTDVQHTWMDSLCLINVFEGEMDCVNSNMFVWRIICIYLYDICVYIYDMC